MADNKIQIQLLFLLICGSYLFKISIFSYSNTTIVSINRGFLAGYFVAGAIQIQLLFLLILLRFYLYGDFFWIQIQLLFLLIVVSISNTVAFLSIQIQLLFLLIFTTSVVYGKGIFIQIQLLFLLIINICNSINTTLLFKYNYCFY